MAAALCASLATASALALQAAEARREPDERVAQVALIRQMVRRPRWVAGVLLLAVGWALQLTALGFAPLTVVQPLLSLDLLVLLVIGRLWLREPVGWGSLASVLAIAAGVVIVELAAPHEQLQHARRVPLIVGLVALTAGVGAGTVSGRTLRRGPLLLIAAAGLGYGASDFTAKLLTNGATGDHWAAAAGWTAACVAFGVVALADETVVLAKPGGDGGGSCHRRDEEPCAGRAGAVGGWQRMGSGWRQRRDRGAGAGGRGSCVGVAIARGGRGDDARLASGSEREHGFGRGSRHGELMRLACPQIHQAGVA